MPTPEISTTVDLPTNPGVRGYWYQNGDDGRTGVHLTIGPEGDEYGQYGGLLGRDPSGDISMTGLALHVKKGPEHRRKGHATRLTEALAHVAVAHGAVELVQYVESQHTVKILRDTVGEERVSATGDDGTPMTAAEAEAFLTDAEAREKDLENRETALHVTTDLRGLSADGLRPPIMSNEPLPISVYSPE